MQFLWLYVDDLMGKGLEISIILELMLYASANVVPMALPLSILLASIMTFGNLGESNELTAMKASGMSLFRIMRPLTIFMMFVAAGAFYFSNNLWPLANFKMRVLISDIQQTKAAIVLKEGVFYNEVENFSIRVGEKDENGKDLYDLLIYDHSESAKHNSYNRDPRDHKRVIRAKRGRINQSDDKKQLLLELYDGYIVQEMSPNSIKDTKMPFMRYYFEEANLNFDLQGFELEKTDEDLYQKEEYLLNLAQIAELKDSTFEEAEKRYERENTYNQNLFLLTRTHNDSTGNLLASYTPTENYFDNLSPQDQKKNLHSAISRIKGITKHLEIEEKREQIKTDYLMKLEVEWHRKFTLAYASMMLFFLGAPLGAIVKKGGLGWPVLIAILLFLVYFIITRVGDEMAISGGAHPILGMWLSAFILTPIAAFISIKSNNDSKLFDREFYIKLLTLNFGQRKK